MSRGQRMLMLALNKSLRDIHAFPASNEKTTGFKRRRLESNANASCHDDGESCARHDEVVTQSGSHSGDCVDPIVPPATKRARSAKDRDLRQATKHAMLACCSCMRKCLDQINEARREEIHRDFWDLSYNSRRVWIYSQIERTAPKRKRTEDETTGKHARKYAASYSMPDENGVNKKVCKKFFLHTLGYKSDKVITVLMAAHEASALTPKTDMRGKHSPSNKLSDDTNKLIKEHIESYHPAVSHYRREHAPFRKYLPPELTVTDMYNDFVEKHAKVSYQTYRRVVSSMNISFVKLGEEECEECMLHESHQHVDRDATEDCTECIKWKEHIERARVSRKHYQDDGECILEDDTCIMSVDMQKVQMLPRLPGVKTCVFTRRLVAFHETFAPIGKLSKRPIVSVLWHEALSGRNAEDLASVFIKFMQYLRDVRHFIFYVDNCGAQNKNWTLFTALTAVVNFDSGPDSVILRYLEKGHTFMSADSYHAKVESSLRKMKNVYDYNDFATVVERRGAKVINMAYKDFVLWENGMSSAKFTNKPTLSNVHEVLFRRGSIKMFWKLNMDDEVYEEGEFLKKKTAQMHTSQRLCYATRMTPRGICSKKKEDLLTKLCPFMPTNRRLFWNSLAVDDDSADLIDNE